MSHRLERLIEELDYTRAEVRRYEKQKLDCERALWELRNQEKSLKRRIEREAHLYM